MHEVTITERCDFCRADLAKKPTAVRGRPVTVDGKAVLVDACPRCARNELIVLDTIAENSRPAEAPKQRKRRSKGSEQTCPEPGCGTVVKNDLGMSIHMSRAHGRKP